MKHLCLFMLLLAASGAGLAYGAAAYIGFDGDVPSSYGAPAFEWVSLPAASIVTLAILVGIVVVIGAVVLLRRREKTPKKEPQPPSETDEN